MPRKLALESVRLSLSATCYLSCAMRVEKTQAAELTSKVLVQTVVKLSCFGFGSAKGKKGSRNNAMDQENSSRCHFDDSFSDMVRNAVAKKAIYPKH